MENTIAEIQTQIDRKEAALEPERLFWDGERDRGEAMREGAKLRAELAVLRQKLAELSK